MSPVKRCWAAGAAALALGLAACQPAVPLAQPLPKPAEPPAVVEAGQIQRILADLGLRLEAGQAALSAEAMEPRLGGAALAMVEAQFKAKAADESMEIPFALGTRFVDGQIVTRQDSWPRSFVAVTEPEAPEAPYLYQLEQADARSPYKLVAWAKMLSGADLPATAPAEVGSAWVAPTAAGLALAPQAAVEAYAQAKDAAEGEAAALFDTAPQDGRDPDPARARWLTTVEALQGGIAAFDGTSTAVSEMVEGSVFALATADSGALVFGQVRSVFEAAFTTPGGERGGSVDLGQQYYLGLGAATLNATKSVMVDFLQTVVLAVPPEGSKDPIRVIAVADTPIAAAVE
ncbi:MAG: hypothetical protein LBD51_06270 [Bifidobacteriaceae bacterium]|jgi:hypothetical protein|nr:hypothetical protein [Bifidobacteriaceae bacterium]